MRDVTAGEPAESCAPKGIGTGPLVLDETSSGRGRTYKRGDSEMVAMVAMVAISRQL
jgi:hypothetical protein